MGRSQFKPPPPRPMQERSQTHMHESTSRQAHAPPPGSSAWRTRCKGTSSRTHAPPPLHTTETQSGVGRGRGWHIPRQLARRRAGAQHPTAHQSSAPPSPPTRGPIFVEDGVHLCVAHIRVLGLQGVPPLRPLGPGQLRGMGGRGRGDALGSACVPPTPRFAYEHSHVGALNRRLWQAAVARHAASRSKLRVASTGSCTHRPEAAPWPTHL